MKKYKINLCRCSPFIYFTLPLDRKKIKTKNIKKTDFLSTIKFQNSYIRKGFTKTPMKSFTISSIDKNNYINTNYTYL